MVNSWPVDLQNNKKKTTEKEIENEKKRRWCIVSRSKYHDISIHTVRDI